jgi:hypothetical protein
MRSNARSWMSERGIRPPFTIEVKVEVLKSYEEQGTQILAKCEHPIGATTSGMKLNVNTFFLGLANLKLAGVGLWC